MIERGAPLDVTIAAGQKGVFEPQITLTPEALRLPRKLQSQD
jgi:hypothetical protein